MPKLYEYLGLIIFFYSNEHEPVHVHARSQGHESKIELIIDDGRVTEIKLLDVKGKKPLSKKQLKDFEDLVTKLSDEIVQQWVSYFVYHKKIVTKKIQGKL
jgi:hypothetical protein